MSSVFDYLDTLGAQDIDIDLAKEFPRPWRSGVRNQFVLIFSYILILVISFFQVAETLAGGVGTGLFFDILSYVTFNIFFGGLFLVSMALLYEEFHHETYGYGLDSGNLIIVKGVFVKKRSSFPLNKISDVYLDRGWIDLIFFLYNLNFSTANDMSFDKGRITGLDRKGAVNLQQLLTTIVARGEEEAVEEINDESTEEKTVAPENMNSVPDEKTLDIKSETKKALIDSMARISDKQSDSHDGEGDDRDNQLNNGKLDGLDEKTSEDDVLKSLSRLNRDKKGSRRKSVNDSKKEIARQANLSAT